MKTAISIPDPLFKSGEQLARRLGVSRSELYARALAALVDSHRDDVVTSRLNAVYQQAPGEAVLDPALAELQARSLGRSRW